MANVSSSNTTTLYSTTQETIIQPGAVVNTGQVGDANFTTLYSSGPSQPNVGNNLTVLGNLRVLGTSDLEGPVTICNSYTLPTSDGLAGQVITTDGAGNLSFTVATGVGKTYDISAAVVVGGANLNLNSNVPTTDSVKFAAGSGMTVVATDANTITISNISPGTTYDFNASSTTGGVNLNLVGSDSTTDTVKLSNGTGVTVSYVSGTEASIAIGQDVATTANPTFAGGTFGNITIAIADDNTITTTTGDLKVGSATNNVRVLGDLTVDNAITINADQSGTASINVYGNTFTNSITFENPGPLSTSGLWTINEATRIVQNTTSTNSAPYALLLQSNSTGTPVVGFGTGMSFEIEAPSSTIVQGSAIEIRSTDLTAGAEDFTMNFRVLNNGTYSGLFQTQLDGVGNLTAAGDLQAYGNIVLNTDNSPGATAGLYAYSGVSGTTLGSIVWDGTRWTTSTNLTTNGALRINGSSSGYSEFSAAATGSNLSYVLPSAQGAAATVLTNDGAGNLSWALPGGGGSTFGNITIGVVTDNTISTTTGDLFITSNNGLAGTIDIDGNVYATSTTVVPHTFIKNSAVTNNGVGVISIQAESTGTPTVGFGPVIIANSELGNGDIQTVGYLGWRATDMTPNAENFQVEIAATKAGALPDYKFYIDSDGNISADGNLTLNVDQTAATTYLYANSGATQSNLSWDGSTWVFANNAAVVGSGNFTANDLYARSNVYLNIDQTPSQLAQLIAYSGPSGTTSANITWDGTTWSTSNNLSVQGDLEYTGGDLRTTNALSSFYYTGLGTHTFNIDDINTTSGNTKTISIGANGQSGSITNVTVGSSTAGSISNFNVLGTAAADDFNARFDMLLNVDQTPGYSPGLRAYSGAGGTDLGSLIWNGTSWTVSNNLAVANQLNVTGDVFANDLNSKSNLALNYDNTAGFNPGIYAYSGPAGTTQSSLVWNGTYWEIGDQFHIDGALRLKGSSSGYTEIAAAATGASIVYTLPSAQGAASTVLTNDGFGNLTWALPGGGGSTFGNVSIGVVTDNTISTTTGDLDITSTTGVINLDNYTAFTDNRLTTTSTATVTLDSLAIATYQSASYSITVKDNVTGATQFTKIDLLHDGTTAYIDQYSNMASVADLATFSATISGANAVLQITPASANSTQFTFNRIATKV